MIGPTVSTPSASITRFGWLTTGANTGRAQQQSGTYDLKRQAKSTEGNFRPVAHNSLGFGSWG